MDQQAELLRAVELLRAGRLVAVPTETVYGLAANALDASAVSRIFQAKGRPLTSPLIVHVATVGQARDLAAVWPMEAEKLAQAFWPGPLTIIVPKKPCVPDLVTAGLPSVGLRIPSHPLTLELLRLCELPLAAPSANLFTGISPTTAEHVRQGLGGAVDLVLDGGPCDVGIESTVVSLAGTGPRILRPGQISRDRIEAVIGAVEVGAGAESPGQHPKHYSPKTRVILGPAPGTGIGAILNSANMPSDAHEYARRLYGLLHELDAKGLDWIAIEPPPELPEWAGIRDRLVRASSPV